MKNITKLLTVLIIAALTFSIAGCGNIGKIDIEELQKNTGVMLVISRHPQMAMTQEGYSVQDTTSPFSMTAQSPFPAIRLIMKVLSLRIRITSNSISSAPKMLKRASMQTIRKMSATERHTHSHITTWTARRISSTPVTATRIRISRESVKSPRIIIATDISSAN